MADRITVVDCRRLCDLLNKETKGGYSIEQPFGGTVRLLKGERDVSRAMKAKDLHTWMHAYRDGIDEGKKLQAEDVAAQRQAEGLGIYGAK